MYVCSSIVYTRIFVENFKKFVPRFHGCHVSVALQWVEVWNADSTMLHGSTIKEN